MAKKAKRVKVKRKDCADVRNSVRPIIRKHGVGAIEDILFEMMVILEDHDKTIADLVEDVNNLSDGVAPGNVSEATVQELANVVDSLADIVRDNQAQIVKLFGLLEEMAKKL